MVLVLWTTIVVFLISTGATIKIPIPLPISCINWLGYAQSKMIFHLLVRVGGVEPPHFHFVAPIL